MSDLVDRLRRQMSPKTYIGEPLLTFTDLIDEIERLTAENAALRAELAQVKDDYICALLGREEKP